MAIVKMQKVRLFLYRPDASSVLRAVQKFGNVEFTEVDGDTHGLQEGENTEFEFNYVSSRLDTTVEFLRTYAPADGKLKSMFEGDRLPVTGRELFQTAKTFSYNNIIDRVQTIEQELSEADTRIKELHAEQSLLREWESLDMPLSLPRETDTTETLFIHAPNGVKVELETLLSDADVAYHVECVDGAHMGLTFLKEKKSVVEDVLKNLSLDTVTFPMRRGTPKEEIARIDDALVKYEKTIVSNEEEARAIAAEHLPKLRMVSDFMLWRKNNHELLASAHHSDSVAVFEGWTPIDTKDELERVIQNKTSRYQIEDIQPEEGEFPPVEIKNNRLVQPFESVTRLYGLPGHEDIDPTMFLAGFFFIFFGLSLTDVGYGIILFLITASALFFYNVPKEMKPLLSLFMFGGIASTLVGLFFGGYLGIDMSLMPQWVQALQAFDPITNPIPVFYLALGLGVVQIIAGLALKILREARNGNFMDGLLDQGPWIFMFLSLILWGGASFGFIPADPQYYLYVVYAAVASLILTQGRKEKNMFMKGLKGVFSLYDSINYFSDVLSYSRLLALGLATSALAFAVNLIAGMVRDVPVVGLILMATILVIGHLFNLAVNVLGAFIHSSRLQFVEFFGKFISGSGRLFKPFKREERFVALKVQK